MCSKCRLHFYDFFLCGMQGLYFQALAPEIIFTVDWQTDYKQGACFLNSVCHDGLQYLTTNVENLVHIVHANTHLRMVYVFWLQPHVAQTVKNLPAMWETWVQSLGQEDSLEKGMATHSSVLAWRIPWTEEPGRLQS